MRNWPVMRIVSESIVPNTGSPIRIVAERIRKDKPAKKK